jgi:hypothetical protein
VVYFARVVLGLMQREFILIVLDHLQFFQRCICRPLFLCSFEVAAMTFSNHFNSVKVIHGNSLSESDYSVFSWPCRNAFLNVVQIHLFCKDVGLGYVSSSFDHHPQHFAMYVKCTQLNMFT